jgi:outer membrane protein OmpA-like peptidoglycan-associated protein
MRAAAALLVALIFGGCAQPPKSKDTYSERVTLLPNRDGRPSAVIVKRSGVEERLEKPYESLALVEGRQQRAELAQNEVEKRYGEVLQAQPARPFTYTLFFNTGTTELTRQSRASLAEVRQKIGRFPAAQVSVTGHADRVGSFEHNDALSLKRAAVVRDLLIEIGIPRAAIEVVARGEREPLVATPDGVAEELNRRVEIKLR